MRQREWAFLFILTSAVSVTASPADTGQDDTGHPHGDRFDLDCSQCHTVNDWKPLRSPLEFDHLSTGFHLGGAHGDIGCQDCHESLEFSNVGAACVDCHADPHVGELGFECQTCHSTTTWDNQRAVFDAHSATLFPLFAAHANLECDACHGGQQVHQYAITPTDCYSCHLHDFNTTIEPNHVAAGFPTECETCHSPVAARWSEAVFQHPSTFLLDGAHARVDCEGCHSDGFAGTPTQCDSCHLQDYQATTDPAHAAAGFPLECESCHGTGAWTPALFNHDATGFPLRGRHQPLECESCHADGYTGTPNDCFSCHRIDFQTANDPDHSGFPTSCESCHNENGWEGAVFDHNRTAFPLRDSHADVDCESCHTDGYTGTPTDCFSCHADEYNQTRDPDHQAARFPTTCESCHRPTRWEDSDWDHGQFFPIFSGSHRGAWDTCADCHIATGNFAVFECIFCHEHRQSEMDDEHDDVSGYRWESRACLDCHPDGEE